MNKKNEKNILKISLQKLQHTRTVTEL